MQRLSQNNPKHLELLRRGMDPPCAEIQASAQPKGEFHTKLSLQVPRPRFSWGNLPFSLGQAQGSAGCVGAEMQRAFCAPTKNQRGLNSACSRSGCTPWFLWDRPGFPLSWGKKSEDWEVLLQPGLRCTPRDSALPLGALPCEVVFLV